MDSPPEEPISAFGAWGLARIRAGQTLNGELDRIDERFRDFAERLNATIVDERDTVWGKGLELLPEKVAARLVACVAAADPDSPPPDAGTWPPLRLGNLPPVLPFPVEILPPSARRLVEEASSAIGCDPAFAGCNVLAVAAGTMGRSRSLCLRENYFAHACLFICNVGHPGDGKTPASAYPLDAIRRLDREFMEEFRLAKEQYKADLKDYQKAGGEGPPPEKPVPVRLGIDDTTIEALFRVMAANPRGLMMSRDELVALIKGLNQYKGGAGADRSNVLKIWSGQPFSVDRVLNELGEPIFIPHPMVTIAGNLTPSSLPLMGSGEGDDGFFDRWLFAFPDRRCKLKSAQRSRVAGRTLDDWAEVARRLWGLELEHRDGRDMPKIVFLSDAGRDEFNRLFDLHVDEVNAQDFEESLRGPWSKLEEYAGRLCLVLTVLRHACDPTADQEVIPLVSAQDARDAWTLVDFFKAHHRRARAYLEGKGLGGAPDGVRMILRWLWSRPSVAAFSERDLTRFSPKFARNPDHLEDCLQWLEQRRAVRKQDKPEKPKGKAGSTPSQVWEVHPSLSDQRNQRNQQTVWDSADSADSADRCNERRQEGGAYGRQAD